jgi:LmbE family N-acetylglucosaminyl deacetylase
MADILVFGAHPDDAEFGMGASMAKFVRCGASVTVCVLTRGEAGTFGTAEQREGEMRAAARRLGGEIEILDFKDCQVFDSYASRAALAAVIRRHRPRIIFSPYHTNPSSHLDGAAHPDHLATGLIVKSAARYARFAGLKDIPGEPWNADSLLYYMVPRSRLPTILNDVSDFMEEWESIARCHESQMALRDGKVMEALRKFRQNYGIVAGVAFAEGFIMEEPVMFDMRSFLERAAPGSVRGVQQKAGCPDIGE